MTRPPHVVLDQELVASLLEGISVEPGPYGAWRAELRLPCGCGFIGPDSTEPSSAVRALGYVVGRFSNPSHTSATVPESRTGAQT